MQQIFISTTTFIFRIYVFVPVHFLNVRFVFKHSSNAHIKVNLSVCPILFECIVLIIVRRDRLASYRPVCIHITSGILLHSFCMPKVYVYANEQSERKRKREGERRKGSAGAQRKGSCVGVTF